MREAKTALVVGALRPLGNALVLLGALNMSACNALEAEPAQAVSPASERHVSTLDAAALVEHTQAHLQGDLDGNGAEDDVYLLSGIELAAFRDGRTQVQDLWQYEEPSHDPADATGESEAILIRLAAVPDGQASKFLLVSLDSVSFLASVTAEDLLILGREELEGDYPELFEGGAGAVISILSEAGIDTFVYWEGEGFGYFEPEEMP